LVSVEFVQEVAQVGVRERQLVGLAVAFVASFEAGEALLDHVEVREVVGRGLLRWMMER
jgi:hypothetical protein